MSDNLEKCSNYLRIIRLIVEVGTKTVRGLFYHFKPKKKIAEFFASSTIFDELLDLKRKHVITSEQFGNLMRDPDPDKMDLSLLITLLVNLFKWTIGTPINGWDKPLLDHDHSLGASLLRLKKIRNELVGHSADATLSTKEFETFWEKTEAILLKMAREVHNYHSIKVLIRNYRISPLESRDDEYVALLRSWYEDGVKLVSTVQDEVEELCKTTNEFSLFFKSNIPDRYKRYILLLTEGGLLVLGEVLKRELIRSYESLKSMLRQYRRGVVLLCRGTCPIYNGERIETDISKWGLRHLANITLHFFLESLSRLERKAISGIRIACEEYANIAMMSLDSDNFRTHWTDIVSNLNILSARLDDHTQERCQNLIKKHDCEPIDETTVQASLLQLRRYSMPTDSLVHKYIEAKEKLKQAVEHMQREGICFRTDQVVELKMMTHGTSKEKRDLAEQILFEIWQKAESVSIDRGNFKAIKKAAEEILTGIRNLDKVNIASIERSCIIISFKCSSTKGLIDLFDFLECQSFVDNSHTFNSSLSDYCREQIIVTSFITIDSIYKMTENLHTDQEFVSKDITFKLDCSSTDGIYSLQQFIELGETANNINNIAQALSEYTGDDISIVTSMDTGGFEDMYNESPFCFLETSKWTPYLLPFEEISLNSVDDVEVFPTDKRQRNKVRSLPVLPYSRENWSHNNNGCLKNWDSEPSLTTRPQLERNKGSEELWFLESSSSSNISLSSKISLGIDDSLYKRSRSFDSLSSYNNGFTSSGCDTGGSKGSRVSIW